MMVSFNINIVLYVIKYYFDSAPLERTNTSIIYFRRY